MKILTGKQIREADLKTMERAPISSYMLMERASEALAEHIRRTVPHTWRVLIFAGKGNNGGDGLVIARLLSMEYDVQVVALSRPDEMTGECRENLERLPEKVCPMFFDEVDADVLSGLCSSGWEGILIVDALLGTGVRGRVHGPAAEAIELINQLSSVYSKSLGREKVRVVSVDLPSGLPTEPQGWNLSDGGESNWTGPAVRADETLTLEFPKLSLLLPETGAFAGRVSVVGIGLDKDYIDSCESVLSYVCEADVEKMFSARNVFAHKGDFGHALIIAGSRGMMGASVLATQAALRSGCGLVTAHIPDSERFIMQISCPCAIVDTDKADCFSALPSDLSRYSAIGVGCGLRQGVDSVRALGELLSLGRPLVLDADALNIIASRPEYLDKIPQGSILTPHLGELERLLGDGRMTDVQRIMAVRKLAERIRSVVVVKGAHTMICTPDGRLIFNMTGNPGMAKGGSGDVLTGLITGLLARGLSPEDAAVAGVRYHGKAGDDACAALGEGSMNASDIASFIRIPH